MRATAFHYRNATGQKVLGGTIGMSDPVDLNAAADQLVGRLDVAVLASGRVSFMHNGAPVDVYLAVSPHEADKARVALAADRQRRADAQAAQDAQQAVLDALIDQHGVAGAIAKLQGV